MKTLKIFILLLIIIFSLSSNALAVLTLTLKDNPTLFDFGSYDPSGSNYSLPEKGVNDGFIVRCRNTGPADGWTLSIDNSGLTEENDPLSTIPSSALLVLPAYAGYFNIGENKWYGTTDTAELADNLLFSTFQDFYGGMEVYQSSIGDPDSTHTANLDDTEVTLLFGISVPGDTKPGTYKCTITFTLTQ